MTEITNILKREIEFMFGRPIVCSRDCIQLSDDVFRVTKSRLNQNTLRRLFGIVKTSYAPAGSTLQILSNYCGFLSLEELQHHRENVTRENDSPEQTNLLNYLVNLFRNTPVETDSSETFRSVVEQTIMFVDRQPLLRGKFQAMVAKTRNGQEYYFMGYSHIDRLNSEFGNGLRYFLKERTDPEAQVLAHSLLVFRGWLTENEHYMNLHLSEIRNLEQPPADSCITTGRYFASLLYDAELKKSSSSDTLRRIQQFHTGLEEMTLKRQIEFELIITEALILTGNQDEGMYYAECILKKLPSPEQPYDSFFQHTNVLKALAMYRTGDNKNAHELLKLIRPTSFDFRNKKMLTIIYGLLAVRLNKKREVPGSPLLMLVEETGFTRLQNLLS